MSAVLATLEHTLQNVVSHGDSVEQEIPAGVSHSATLGSYQVTQFYHKASLYFAGSSEGSAAKASVTEACQRAIR